MHIKVEHISKNSEMQEFSFIYPKKDDSIQETKTKIFQNIKTPMVEPGLLYDDFEAEDMRLVATRDKSPASNDLERAHISLKPNNRKEVAVLKHTMVGLLRDLGVAEESQEYPTDMHAFLSVIQEEQRIYNSVFQEIIRQVTVNMSERYLVALGNRQGRNLGGNSFPLFNALFKSPKTRATPAHRASCSTKTQQTTHRGIAQEQGNNVSTGLRSRASKEARRPSI